MKILFISSGNSYSKASSLIQNQGDSIVNSGHQVEYFTIKGNGALGYLRNIPRIRNKICMGGFDIVHAHYALSAFAATFAGAKPLIVSLMGSDIRIGPLVRFFIRFSHKFLWNSTIIKSSDMNSILKLKEAYIIPNGVNLERFIPLYQDDCRNRLGWRKDRYHILFSSNPKRHEKNLTLAQHACNIIKNELKYDLHYLDGIPNAEMPYYYNASDLLLLTS